MKGEGDEHVEGIVGNQYIMNQASGANRERDFRRGRLRTTWLENERTASAE